ncbi:unnamed protein product [Brachionus calyciflorus]|uniref:Protein kinase domain-containing protein n=1 Tax=Brachionus calyciflorus TaxID=104777 RepID=A0A813RK80_9BILA|nr:unnamed protein product [Brachionus calyciflorus]
MDNFILYDDICKSDHSVIYKGRRKGSINFVAIHCVEKVLRPEITNLVRLTFEMNHKNVIKFYEWYETSNHLWLVVELCSAGTLELILDQDTCLPEASIKKFGIDLCEGLFYIHSLGVLFCDLVPKKIMIDGEGNLKLSDFGFSKAENEDLEAVFHETVENTNSQWTQNASESESKEPKIYKKPFGDISYMAPEILLGEDNSYASDLWSLGCILYKMYTGSCPFFADNDEHLKHMIIYKELPNPKGNKLSTKPSNEFLSLLKGLLEKDPSKRLTWNQLIKHPFWDGNLKHLHQGKSIIVDGKEQILEENEDEEDDKALPLNFSRMSTDRPRASTIIEQKPEINVSFSISSRLPLSPQPTIQTRNPVECKDSDLNESTNTLVSQNFDKEEKLTDTMIESLNEYRRLFFLPSELNASQIVDNPKIQKPVAMKFEPKALTYINAKLFKAENFTKISKDEYSKVMETIKANTNVPTDKSAGAIKQKLHLMNYIGTMCCESNKIADSLIQVELYKDLLNIIKNGHNLEMKMKASRIFGILFNKAKKLEESKELTEVIQNLVDVISANRKDLKFKQALLPALGEIIYFICCQEEQLGNPVENWTIPSLAYVLLIRNIGEDLISNHIICKIIENIASTTTGNVKKFLNNPAEIVNALWSCFNHSANNENLRVAALNALSMLSSHSIDIFSTLVDKVGPDAILDCLSHNNSHIQLPILTMIAMLTNETNSKNLPEKKLLPKLVQIYESTSVPCRSKAYILTFVLLKQQSDLLIPFSQSKLINSLERDIRKNFPIKEENDYIHKMINMLIDLIVSISSTILDDNLACLESVYGRKNPSTTQTKIIKRSIPSMIILKVLLTSQTFRSKLIDEDFVEKFAKVIKLSKFISNGELNLDAICGPDTMSEYIDSIIVILDTIIQNNEIMKNQAQKIIKYILPALLDNIDSQNSNLRVESLKIVSEISNLFFNKQNDWVQSDLKDELKYKIETQFFDMLDNLLVQSEPLPFFSLLIIQNTLIYDITLINVLKVKDILPKLMKLLQNYRHKIGSTLVSTLLKIINIWSSSIDPMDLYENGIVEILKSFVMDISKIKKLDDRVTTEVLIDILKIIDNLLKFVSEYVKKALQAKKIGGAGDTMAQQAEKLLQINKPFVACNSFLISLFVNEDQEINELSSKIVWVVMQLFGTECKDILTQDHLNTLMVAIMHSNFKKQKILLRIAKRMITVDKNSLELSKTIGQNFFENMKNLKNSANSEANVALSSLIDEILKLV